MKPFQDVIKNLTDAYLQDSDKIKLNDMTSIKIFKLMQYSISYMQHTQDYYSSILNNLEAEYSDIQETVAKGEKRIKFQHKMLSSDKIELSRKKYILKEYELMFSWDEALPLSA